MPDPSVTITLTSRQARLLRWTLEDLRDTSEDRGVLQYARQMDRQTRKGRGRHGLQYASGGAMTREQAVRAARVGIVAGGATALLISGVIWWREPPRPPRPPPEPAVTIVGARMRVGDAGWLAAPPVTSRDEGRR